MVMVGLLLGLVGTDVNSGAQRFSMGLPELTDGINFVVIAMGVFGLGEIAINMEHDGTRDSMVKKVTGVWPTREDWRRIRAPIARGTALGAVLGLLPGGGAALASFGAYALEKKISPNQVEFGTGAIEGVAAPEAANNAGAQMSFVPMLTLGIPTNVVMALIIGAMVVHGIQPGPGVMTQQPELFWGVVVSMWVGNVMLLVLNLPLIGLWVKMLSVPYHYLYPMILVFCGIGVYSLSNTTFDVHLMVLFGLAGYVLKKVGCEPAPMLLGFILGPMMEEFLRRALLLSMGDPMTLITSPLSAVLLGLSIILMVLVLLPNVGKKRQEAFRED
jgi:TctA family transporter